MTPPHSGVAASFDNAATPPTEPIDASAFIALWLRPWLWCLRWYIRLAIAYVGFIVMGWVLVTDRADTITSFADVRELLRHAFLQFGPITLIGVLIPAKILYDVTRLGFGRQPYWMTDAAAAFSGVEAQARRLDPAEQPSARTRVLRFLAVWVPVSLVGVALSAFFLAMLNALTIDTHGGLGFVVHGAVASYSILLLSVAASFPARHWTGATQWPVWPQRRARIAARMRRIGRRLAIPRPRRRWQQIALPSFAALIILALAGAIAARYMLPLHHQDLAKGQYDNVLFGFYLCVTLSAAAVSYTALATWTRGPADDPAGSSDPDAGGGSGGAE